jgi:hypothetical protein
MTDAEKWQRLMRAYRDDDEAIGQVMDRAGIPADEPSWSPERPTQTTDFPPTDEFAGDHPIEEDPHG